MPSGEKSFKERRAPWRGELCRKILQGEESFVETLFWERTAPGTSPGRENRHGEKAIAERKSSWRTSPEREKRHGEPLQSERKSAMENLSRESEKSAMEGPSPKRVFFKKKCTIKIHNKFAIELCTTLSHLHTHFVYFLLQKFTCTLMCSLVSFCMRIALLCILQATSL
jgi:hypothetical protein